MSEPDTQKRLTVGIPSGALLQRCHSEPYRELRSPLGRLGIYRKIYAVFWVFFNRSLRTVLPC